VNTLVYTGLSNALLATVLAFVAAAVGRVCRRPALVHGLWLLVLLKLLTPPLVALPLLWPAYDRPAAENAAISRRLPTPSAVTAEDAAWQARIEAAVKPLHLAPEPALSTARREESTPVDNDAAWQWQGVIVAGWLASSALWCVLAGRRLVRFQRCLRLAQPMPGAVQARAHRLADRLGLRQCPSLLGMDASVSPMLWAMFGTPRLILPVALWDRLSPAQQDTLLAHELAHLRRGDHLVRWLEAAALALYWWHPVVWWARRRLQEAEEQCCDAWVVWALPDATLDYADALVATLVFVSKPGIPLPVGASGVGRTYQIKRRLTMILNRTAARALSWPWFLLVLLLGAALLPWRPTWAELAPRDERDLPPAKTQGDQEPQPKQPAKASRTDDAQPKLPMANETPTKKAPPNVPGRTRAASPVSAAEVETAREEVELMHAQLAQRQGELGEVETRIKSAERRFGRLRQLTKQGAASETELNQAQEELDLTSAQRHTKLALLREAEIRLRQAQRRLDALQASVARAENEHAVGEPKPAENRQRLDRLQALEDTLGKLLKEIQALKNEANPRR
jgi:beta-lactamase regulating signal transducer with metallopeptidase domain